jgi:hypothetical protein
MSIKKKYSLVIVFFLIIQLPIVLRAQETRRLTIISEPDSADVEINDRYMGTTPFVLEQKLGEKFSLRVKKIGYVAYLNSVTISQHLSNEIRVELKRAASLSIKSIPAGAQITLNDRMRGVTPLVIDLLEAGTYKLKVWKEEYYREESTISLTEGEHKELVIKLKQESGYLNVTADAGTKIYVDGVYHVMNSLQNFECIAGYHSVRVVNDSLETDGSKSVFINTNLPTNVTARVAGTNYMRILSSVLVPGLVQFYDGKYFEGMGTFTVWIAGIVGMVSSRKIYDDKLKEYIDVKTTYMQAGNETVASTLHKELETKHQALSAPATFYNISLGLLFGAYIYALGDAFLNHTGAVDFEVWQGLERPAFSLQPSISNEFLAIRLQITF